MSVVGELAVALGFKVDDTKLKAFDANVKSLRNNFVGLVAESIGAVYAIDKLSSGIKASLGNAQALTNYANTTGLKPFIAQVIAANAELEGTGLLMNTTIGQIAGLNSTLNRLQNAGQNTLVLNRAQISNADNADSAVLKLIDVFTNPKATNYGFFQKAQNRSDLLNDLGLDARLGPVLTKPFEILKKNAIAHHMVMSDAEQENQQNVNKGLAETNAAFNYMYRTLTDNLAPALRIFNKGLMDLAGAYEGREGETERETKHRMMVEDVKKNGTLAAAAHATMRDIISTPSSALQGITEFAGHLASWSSGQGWNASNDNKPTFDNKPADDYITIPKKPETSLTPSLFIDDKNVIRNPQPSGAALQNLKTLKSGDDDYYNFHHLAKPSNPVSGNTTSYNIKIDVNGSDQPLQTAQEVFKQFKYSIALNQTGNGGLA